MKHLTWNFSNKAILQVYWALCCYSFDFSAISLSLLFFSSTLKCSWRDDYYQQNRWSSWSSELLYIYNKTSITSHAYQSSPRLKAQLIYAVICTTTSRQIYVLKHVCVYVYVLLHTVIIIAPRNEAWQRYCVTFL